MSLAFPTAVNPHQYFLIPMIKDRWLPIKIIIDISLEYSKLPFSDSFIYVYFSSYDHLRNEFIQIVCRSCLKGQHLGLCVHHVPDTESGS